MSDDEFQFGNYDKMQMTDCLVKADSDPALAGFVYPQDLSRKRLPIFKEQTLVGFATPRQDKDDVWRMGAIWIAPAYRGRGLAKKAIRSFMCDKKGRAFIEDDNIPSQKAYMGAGFRIVRADSKNRGNWWENF